MAAGCGCATKWSMPQSELNCKLTKNGLNRCEICARLTTGPKNDSQNSVASARCVGGWSGDEAQHGWVAARINNGRCWRPRTKSNIFWVLAQACSTKEAEEEEMEGETCRSVPGLPALLACYFNWCFISVAKCFRFPVLHIRCLFCVAAARVATCKREPGSLETWQPVPRHQ